MKCEKHGEQATICRFCDAETIAGPVIMEAAEITQEAWDKLACCRRFHPVTGACCQRADPSHARRPE